MKDVKRSFHTALKKAGITNFHFHDLRHTSASHLVMEGASMKTAQEHLEHTSPSMTQRYAHLSNEFRREEIQRLNGLYGEIGKKLVRNEEIEKTFQGTINATA